MSRSVHRNRRDLVDAKRSDFSDSAKRTALVQKIRQQLVKKRSTKYRVSNERRWAEIARRPTVISLIPIHVRDTGRFIQYPASPVDLPAVMERVPRGVLDGLNSVELKLAEHEQYDPAEAPTSQFDPDPFTGRRGIDLWPGVYAGHILGQYLPNRAAITLHAFVYPPDAPYREIYDLYLRLQMLGTFVHQVAHRFDHLRRVRRGKWLADVKFKNEMHGEAREWDWTQRCVVPYLETAYPDELKALDTWTRHGVGFRFPYKN